MPTRDLGTAAHATQNCLACQGAMKAVLRKPHQIHRGMESLLYQCGDCGWRSVKSVLAFEAEAIFK
jgi:hypothetical protein